MWMLCELCKYFNFPPIYIETWVVCVWKLARKCWPWAAKLLQLGMYAHAWDWLGSLTVGCVYTQHSLLNKNRKFTQGWEGTEQQVCCLWQMSLVNGLLACKLVKYSNSDTLTITCSCDGVWFAWCGSREALSTIPVPSVLSWLYNQLKASLFCCCSLSAILRQESL